MNARGRQSGLTLVEALVASSMVGFVVVGVAALCSAAFQANGRTQRISADAASATSALQMIYRDVEQANGGVLNSPTDITLTYGLVSKNGSYDRRFVDVTHPIRYFVGDDKGHADPKGTVLWRQMDVRPDVLLRNVASVTFAMPQPDTVDVSLSTSGQLGASTQLLHRSALMRNYWSPTE